MISATDARKRADDIHAARNREYEDRVERLWESWGPNIEKSIEESSEKGKYYCTVYHSGEYKDMSAIRDMLARKVKPYGYKLELYWMSAWSYRLKIEWQAEHSK